MKAREIRSRGRRGAGEGAERGPLGDWLRLELIKAAEIRGGATPRRDNPACWNGDIPWLTPTDLPAAGAGIVDVETTADAITEEGLASCSASLLPPGTVLFSSRASIGKIGIAAVPLTTNQGFANLIPRDGVESRYLAWCLHFHADRIVGLAGSTTFKEVSKSALKRFRIPVPTPSEQCRIVEILDQADRLRRPRAEADAKADRILPALFLEMFGDPATNPMGWTTRPLGELTGHITSGSRGWAKYAGRGEGFFVRTQDIDNGEISTRLLPIDPPAGAESERTRLAEGDVVITITGVVGKAAVVRDTPCDLYVSQHVAVVRPRRDQLLPDYFAAYANLPLGDIPVLARLQYGQTKPGLGFRELRTARIRIPPVDLQSTFAERALALRGLQNATRTSQRALRSLWDSVLHRAFAGCLNASWREAHMQELLQEMEQQAKALATE